MEAASHDGRLGVRWFTGSFLGLAEHQESAEVLGVLGGKVLAVSVRMTKGRGGLCYKDDLRVS